jgi:ABC-2 type transport system permease protein
VSATPAQPWRALWFLYSRSWQNRIRLQLRRLRQPRYMVGALAMSAYVVSLLLRPSADVVVAADLSLLDVRQLLAIAGIALALGAWWLAAPTDNALAFSPAEVYFLFPAPVKRRTLVQARLFSVQAVLLVQVLIWTLLLRRGSGDLNGVLRATGLWILFTTVSLHRLGATLARTHAPDAPRRRPVARSIAVLYITVVAMLVALTAGSALDTWRTAIGDGTTDAARVLGRMMAGRLAVQTILDAPLVHALLWPIRAVTAPAFASDAATWLSAIPGALAVLLLHYLWILRDPQPFEELAVGSSARFADRVARMQRGAASARTRNVRIGWTLALRGNPAVALAWKNVTAATRTFRARPILVTIIIVVAVVVVTMRNDASKTGGLALRSAFATTFLSIFVASVLTAPAWFRLDLRHDLAHLPFLKTAPLPAHTIVATEILTAAAITTVAMAGLFGPPAYLLLRSIGGPLGSGGLLLAMLGATLALGGVNLLHVTLYNAVALWLPAWVPLNQGGASTGGASVVGQVYITLIGIITSLGVLLALPAGAAWGIMTLLLPHLSITLVAVLCLIVALAIITLEWLGLARLLGQALDRLEPSDIPSLQA